MIQRRRSPVTTTAHGSWPPAIHAWSVACSAAVRHAALPASVAALPLHTMPVGIVPFWIRTAEHAPLVLPAHEYAFFCVSA